MQARIGMKTGEQKAAITRVDASDAEDTFRLGTMAGEGTRVSEQARRGQEQRGLTPIVPQKTDAVKKVFSEFCSGRGISARSSRRWGLSLAYTDEALRLAIVLRCRSASLMPTDREGAEDSLRLADLGDRLHLVAAEGPRPSGPSPWPAASRTHLRIEMETKVATRAPQTWTAKVQRWPIFLCGGQRRRGSGTGGGAAHVVRELEILSELESIHGGHDLS